MPQTNSTNYEKNKKKLNQGAEQMPKKAKAKQADGEKKIPQEKEMKSKKRESEEVPTRHAEKGSAGYEKESRGGRSEEEEHSHSNYESSALENEKKSAKQEGSEESHIEASSEIYQNGDGVHLEFYGSEYIRMKAPHFMDFAETVVEEWQQDGDFDELPVENALAQLVAAKALRKAKGIEKTLEEKGVFDMARTGVDYVRSKIDRKNE